MSDDTDIPLDYDHQFPSFELRGNNYPIHINADTNNSNDTGRYNPPADSDVYICQVRRSVDYFSRAFSFLARHFRDFVDSVMKKQMNPWVPIWFWVALIFFLLGQWMAM